MPAQFTRKLFITPKLTISRDTMSGTTMNAPSLFKATDLVPFDGYIKTRVPAEMPLEIIVLDNLKIARVSVSGASKQQRIDYNFLHTCGDEEGINKMFEAEKLNAALLAAGNPKWAEIMKNGSFFMDFFESIHLGGVKIASIGYVTKNSYRENTGEDVVKALVSMGSKFNAFEPKGIKKMVFDNGNSEFIG